MGAIALDNGTYTTTISNSGATSNSTIDLTGVFGLKWDSGWFSATSRSTSYAKTHNQGNAEYLVKVLMKVTNARNGYSVGDIIDISANNGFINDVYDKKGWVTRCQANVIYFITAQSDGIFDTNTNGDDVTRALYWSDVQFKIQLIG